MPLIAGPVQTIYRTRIFARGRSDGKQLLAFSMAYRATGEAVLAIPLATPPDVPQEIVSLISLPKGGTLFADLARGQPDQHFGDASDIASLPMREGASPLFVPNLSILMQLIGHLPMPAGVSNDLQAYAANSFAMVTLPAGDAWLHPFALEFPRRKPDQLRFPSGILKGALFDLDLGYTCELFAQSRVALTGWEPSGEPGPIGKLRLAGQFLDTRLSRNVIDPMRPVYHRVLYADSTQRDTVVYEHRVTDQQAAPQ
jgi:hypothetical protein